MTPTLEMSDVVVVVPNSNVSLPVPTMALTASSAVSAVVGFSGVSDISVVSRVSDMSAVCGVAGVFVVSDASVPSIVAAASGTGFGVKLLPSSLLDCTKLSVVKVISGVPDVFSTGEEMATTGCTVMINGELDSMFTEVVVMGDNEFTDISVDSV